MKNVSHSSIRKGSRGLMLAALLAASLAPSTEASAQGRSFGLAPPSDPSGPPGRYLDEASLRVQLNTGGSGSENYRMSVLVSGSVHGRELQRADAMRLEYKVGSRTVATARCSIEGFDGFNWPNINGNAVGTFSCETEKVIDTAEDAVIQLTYQDDADDRAIAFRPLNIRVGASPYWSGSNNYNLMNYVNNPGLVGASTIWLRNRPFGRGPKVVFTFWANPRAAARRPDETSFRCYLNGERIRENIEVGGTALHGRGGNYSSYQPQSGDPDEYGYTYYELSTGLTYNGQGGQGDRYDLAEHPGDYRCQLKVNGTAVRDFHFTVSADGSIPAHPEQLGAGALYLTPGRVLVDTRFPTPTEWDHGFDPDSIRGGSFYGRPWRDASSLSAMMGALPAAAVGAIEAPSAPGGSTLNGHARPVAAPAGRGGRGGRSRGRGRRR